MNEEHKECLKGWVQGEEILEYIERIEKENKLLEYALLRYNQALEKSCVFLEVSCRNIDHYEENGEIVETRMIFKNAGEWKEWLLKHVSVI